MIGIINKKIIKELYKEYNTMYFNGVLSLCDCHYIKLDAMDRGNTERSACTRNDSSLC